LGKGERVACVVAMAVGDQDVGRVFGGGGLIVALEGGVAGKPWIDEQDLVAYFDAEAGVA
jgi:hypothetical protein